MPVATPPAPAPSRAAWEAAAAASLKGRAPADLVARTADGIALPLAAGEAPVRRLGRAGDGPWAVAARLDLPNPDAAARQALDDLEGGASALVLAWPGGAGRLPGGLAAPEPGALDRALAGVRLDLVGLRVDAGAGAPAAAAGLLAVAERRGHDAGALGLDLGLDPLAPRGEGAPEGLGAGPAAALAHLRACGAGGRAFAVDARGVHARGGTGAQELAMAVGALAAGLRALAAGGVDPADGWSAFALVLAVDQEVLPGVAKLRAARLLAARLATALGVPPAPITIHAETSARMLARRDAPTNAVRNALAAAAAGLGGADSVLVLPHTLPLGPPDAAARRLARATNLVLVEEAGLARTADPLAGAGAIEQLTGDLAARAWDLFREGERRGGLGRPEALAALLAGADAAGRARAAALTEGRRTLVGVTAFPPPDDAPPTAWGEDAPPSDEGARAPHVEEAAA